MGLLFTPPTHRVCDTQSEYLWHMHVENGVVYVSPPTQAPPLLHININQRVDKRDEKRLQQVAKPQHKEGDLLYPRFVQPHDSSSCRQILRACVARTYM